MSLNYLSFLRDFQDSLANVYLQGKCLLTRDVAVFPWTLLISSPFIIIKTVGTFEDGMGPLELPRGLSVAEDWPDFHVSQDVLSSPWPPSSVITT